MELNIDELEDIYEGLGHLIETAPEVEFLSSRERSEYVRRIKSLQSRVAAEINNQK